MGNGVTPAEASGVLTHRALYSGWPNAVSALEVYDQVNELIIDRVRYEKMPTVDHLVCVVYDPERR